MIDANNQAVPGVTPSSLQTGLELVGQGRVAALVGRLREGAGVVDVDVPGDLGFWITAELSDWLQRQGCWVLTRPSGGAPGRAHIFFAHPEYRYARASERTGLAAKITDYLVSFAAEIKVPARELDLRDAVRPLSSPHRHGQHPAPREPADRALRRLKKVLPTAPAANALPKRAKVSIASTPGTSDARAVIPLQFEQWRRALRPQWRTYLLTGRAPDLKRIGSNETDRSLIEAACTSDLVWAIGDPQTAWRVIREAHPKAMTKARSQGQSWWTRYVWNKAVEDAQKWEASTLAKATSTTSTTVAPDVVHAVLAGRSLLEDLQWTLPPRQRATLLLVGHALLDRVARTGTHRIPCPERDLVLDTGIADRKTIRATLRLLDGRLGTLHRDSFKETERDSSSFEFEVNTAPDPGVRQIPPPAFHPPLARPGLWATLPRASHTLWRALLTPPTDLPLVELLPKAGLTASPTDAPTRSQLVSARAALRALEQAGLAQVTADGTWIAVHRSSDAAIDRDASARYVEMHASVESERAAYRATTPEVWRQGRERAYKSALARQKNWWTGMGEDERRLRSSFKRAEFHQLSLTEQRSRKEVLAARRKIAGLSQADHQAEWLAATSSDEYAQRSRERTLWFASLSPSHKALAVDQWSRFRAAHGLPNRDSVAVARTAADAYFDGAAARDQEFLVREASQSAIPLRLAL